MTLSAWLVLLGLTGIYALGMYMVLLRPMLRTLRWERRSRKRIARIEAITESICNDDLSAQAKADLVAEQLRLFYEAQADRIVA